METKSLIKNFLDFFWNYHILPLQKVKYHNFGLVLVMFLPVRIAMKKLVEIILYQEREVMLVKVSAFTQSLSFKALL